MDELIATAMKPIKGQRFELSVYFGRNLTQRYERLAKGLFQLFPSPLLRASFDRVGSGAGGAWRLKALRRFLEMLENETEPTWAKVTYPKIDYQGIVYYSAPKQQKKLDSLDEVDPEILDTYEERRAIVAGDSCSDSFAFGKLFQA